MCQRSFQSAFRARRWSTTRPAAVSAKSSCLSALKVLFLRSSGNQYGAATPIFHTEVFCTYGLGYRRILFHPHTERRNIGLEAVPPPDFSLL